MAKALEGDRLGEAQAAWRALSRGERREFLRWCQAQQDQLNPKRQPVSSPVEKELAVALSKMAL
jgi:hypothetical protein